MHFILKIRKHFVSKLYVLLLYKINWRLVFVVVCEGESSHWTSWRSDWAGRTRCDRDHEIQVSCHRCL